MKTLHDIKRETTTIFGVRVRKYATPNKQRARLEQLAVNGEITPADYLDGLNKTWGKMSEDQKTGEYRELEA